MFFGILLTFVDQSNGLGDTCNTGRLQYEAKTLLDIRLSAHHFNTTELLQSIPEDLSWNYRHRRRGKRGGVRNRCR